MPLRLRFGQRRPAFQEPEPEPALIIRWTPQPLAVGEVPPVETMAALAAAARPRDLWSGTRDTDRRQ